MTTGDTEITVIDGGGAVVVVPSSSVQVVIGPCSGGTAAQVVPSRDPNVLQGAVGSGPGVEAAAMGIAAGGTVLFMKSATTTPGAISGSALAAKVITAVSSGAVITSTGHGLTTGDVVTVAAVGGAIEVNVTGKITVLTADTFTIDGVTTATAYTSGGTATKTGVRQIAFGTSVVTVTGAPYDRYFVRFLITKAGTVGTTGIRFRISLDAGRNYGPEISLGTAVTYSIVGTNLVLAFAAGTMTLDGYASFACVEPLSAAADVQACLVALEASPYAITGWGSMHIVGIWTGANAATIEGYLDTMVATKTYPRAILSARDNANPDGWGGAGETDATWYAAVALDYSAVSAKRICAAGGYYNMPGQYPIAAAGLPRYRRPGAWALAARQIAIKPQTHAGRVSDGALAQIIVDPTVDPTDGFNYHDERTAPALDAARFTSFRTRKGKPGFFVVNPNLMSPAGSVFTILPLGNVMDIGCSLLHQTGEENINADVRLNDNGTIDEIAAKTIESVVRGVLRDQMLAESMISNFLYTIDRTNNVRSTSKVKFAATLFSRGYILEIDGTIGFGNTTGG